MLTPLSRPDAQGIGGSRHTEGQDPRGRTEDACENPVWVLVDGHGKVLHSICLTSSVQKHIDSRELVFQARFRSLLKVRQIVESEMFSWLREVLLDVCCTSSKENHGLFLIYVFTNVSTYVNMKIPRNVESDLSATKKKKKKTRDAIKSCNRIIYQVFAQQDRPS